VIEGRRTFVNIRKYVLMGTSSNFGNMFSMAAASTFLPFLPLLPAQILLNNLLYDVSEIPIPLDRADEEETARPQQWDMRLIRDFMWALGPVSSLFDFLTFYVLLALFQAHEALFRTGWFIESLATQVLVIFVIRTRASPFASRPHPALAAIAIAVVALAVALPFTPLAAPLGFVAPPPAFLAVLALLVTAYLVLAQLVKRAFYKLSRA
jgi:Mg2+-importing ATPase